MTDATDLTVAQVAEVLGVHENTVRREIRRGNLHPYRAGRALRITQDELARYRRCKNSGG